MGSTSFSDTALYASARTGQPVKLLPFDKARRPQNDLGIIVYAPALIGSDGRTLAVVRGMERALPGLRLGWRISDSCATVSPGGTRRRPARGWTLPQPPPRGLPALKLPWDIRSPEIPHRLGWLNYWSAAAARAIRFPDPARDGELLSRARRASSGGWVVQLTDAPLDLDNPAHLDALLRAYERFPVIGGRAAP